jgi:hypothetical protein
VLIGEDFEIAEFAPLPAKRDVQVQPQRHVGGRRLERRVNLAHLFRRPLRERRVIADEVTTDFSFGGFGGHIPILSE